MEAITPSSYEQAQVADGPPVLEVRGVWKMFGDSVAVENVSFEVSDGEFLFLIGPSGCGKTTTLRMIGGYLEPSRGEIIIRGRRMNDVPLEKRNIGMVFQSYALFPHLTVAENVAFGLRMRGVPRRERAERIASALDLVELSDFADRYPVQLSGGQRQRVAIARVVVYEPDILLLDEPLANLDRRLRDAMRVELKKLQEKVGITTVYVTHDQEEALSMADRIAVMEGGHLLQLGTPSEVYNNPSSSFVATFLGNTSSYQAAVARIDGGFAELEIDGGLAFHVVNGGDLEVGERCMVSIRPERVCLTRETPTESRSSDRNVFRGRVDFLSYLGAGVEYIVALEGTDVTVRAHETLPAGRPTFREGDDVCVSWDPSKTVYLKG